ncbi:hypothetical protein PHK61_29165 [Actinomycetospora lutea]|uniref:DUF7144 family membrane protein n=1 Tax=Actinomycetospora lutea TaxID=663604 RepID=UPI00236583B6|nr:hypothetical protein [Actinomycetospora lutea]MDD7942492.1 hypothetical protein [Actinomycetospora lutea]
MTNDQASTTSGGSTPYSRGAAPRPSGAWTGWVQFGGILMTIVGAFAVIEGFLALFLPTTYVTTDAVALTLTFVGWGWLHIILGALVLVVGLSLLRDEIPGWARGVAIVLVALNTLVQLAWLPAYPIWSILMIVLDVVIIAALVAVGDRQAWSA